MVGQDLEKGEMLVSLMDWRKAARTPPSYRVGTSTMRLQTQFFTVVAVVGFLILLIFYRSSSNDDLQRVASYGVHDVDAHSSLHRVDPVHSLESISSSYNRNYPLSKPSYIHDKIHFKVGVISDMDQMSKSKLESNTWVSYYMLGDLVWDPQAQTVSVTWHKNSYKTLKTSYGYKGRGMELSELVTFDGRLLSFDDRSGIVYVIEEDQAHPWLILSDCDGTSPKGFKSEWATVKGEHLYVGGLGKEWTTPTGEFVNNCPMYVKKISPKGEVESLNWVDNYKALRSHLGIEFPGYMLHESAVWSDIHRRWFFFPRRMSHESYNEEKDEHQGTNVFISCDENFKNIKVVTVGEVLPTHGPSSFKFIPGTQDRVVVALRTTEVSGKTATYIMAFTIDGKILAGETKIGDLKYEGFEFV
uniref:Apyrase n=2 Tax=Lygus hesperus TaxID=30085 RepID=A0A0K8SGY6_LYGHE